MEPKIASRPVASRRVLKSVLARGLAVAGLLLPSTLAAQTPSAAGAASSESSAQRAQRLFDEARALMKQERFAEACAKLAESQTLDPGGGTLLNLGICRLHEGRTATAFRLLGEARDQARAAGRSDRLATAERYLAEVTPLLSRLLLDPPPSGFADGTVIEVDGEALAPGSESETHWLDPGEHALRVSRPHYETFTTTVTLGPNADVKHVAIPELTPLPEAPLAPAVAMPVLPPAPPPAKSPPPAEPAPSAGHSAPPALAYGLLAGGGVAIAAGTYFGAQAFAHKNASNRHFDGTYCTAPSCVDDWNQAKTSALAADVALGVGLAAAGTGLYLLLTHPKSPPTSAASLGVTLGATRSAAFASANGSF
jgi:hypothetical protein